MILSVKGADFGSTGKPRASGDDPTSVDAGVARAL